MKLAIKFAVYLSVVTIILSGTAVLAFNKPTFEEVSYIHRLNRQGDLFNDRSVSVNQKVVDLSNEKSYKKNSGSESNGMGSNNLSSLEWTQDMSEAFSEGCNFLNTNAKSDDYLMVAGITNNVADNINDTTRMISEIKDKKGNYSDCISLSKDIIGIVFSSLNPTDLDGVNLISTLQNYKNINYDDIYQNIYPLLAYDSNDFDVSDNAVNNRTVLIDNILKFQNDDGSFSETKDGSKAVKSTAMALTAISNYSNDSNVKECIQRGTDYLKSKRLPSGLFGNNETEADVGDLCEVITALSSLNISPNDSNFALKNSNLVDILLKYQKNDGGFCVKSGQESSVETTQQAVISLSSVKNRQNPYILQNKIQYSNSDSKSRTVKIIKNIVLFAGCGVILVGVLISTVIILKKERHKQ